MRNLWHEFLAEVGDALSSGDGLWLSIRSAIAVMRSHRRYRALAPSDKNLDEIISTTLRNRGPALAESITRNNPLLKAMLDKDAPMVDATTHPTITRIYRTQLRFRRPPPAYCISGPQWARLCDELSAAQSEAGQPVWASLATERLNVLLCGVPVIPMSPLPADFRPPIFMYANIGRAGTNG